jgi:hypothetical protein
VPRKTVLESLNAALYEIDSNYRLNVGIAGVYGERPSHCSQPGVLHESFKI